MVDVEERKLKKSVKKSERVRWRIWKLQEKEIEEEFERRVVELVDAEAVDLWESYKNGVLKACDDLCGKTKGRRDQGNTWWWNEQVKEALDREKKHLKHGARIDKRKIKVIIEKQEIGQRKWLQKP